MTHVIMPQMGESIFEGTIVKWLKKVGDVVKRDEALFELSTDKIDTEIPSPAEGILTEILVKEGAKVPIQTHLATIGEAKTAPAPTAKTVTAPVAASPKTTPAPVAVQIAANRGNDSGRVLSSPLVRRMAKDHGIDLAQLAGSGWKNRITKKDIQSVIEGKSPEPTPAAKPAYVAAPSRPTPTPAPAASRPTPVPASGRAAPAPVGAVGRVEVVPMSPMRVKIAEHMVASRHTSAHVTTVFEVDMSDVVALRESEKSDYERVYGTKLTFTPFYAMAAISAIKEFPIVNASVDGTNILYKRDINMGIAVALPDGLIVPVIKNAEEKSFLGLCRAVNDVAERARSKKLTLDDIAGGTFTITNPGIYGGMFGTPIINQPQVAIMGIGGIEKRPVVRNDAIAIRSMCYVVLSFDHRVIDGAVADQFMALVKKTLETWNIPIK